MLQVSTLRQLGNQCKVMGLVGVNGQNWMAFYINTNESNFGVCVSLCAFSSEGWCI